MSDILYQIIIYPIELIIEIAYFLFYKILNNRGLSIIGVSLAVNILSLPLYAIAERWQQTERDIQKKLKPKADKIKAVFKGDERYMILSTYYRQNHYHPVYALRSSVSLLIQIPFFIAAYHFISHLEILDGHSFLFIRDLGAPDRLFRVGSFTVNILPIAMTVINVIAGMIYTKGFPLKEKVQLYAMAAIFLILLYNSPSALVLYWTLNNVFSLGKNLFYKAKHPAKLFYVFSCICCAAAALSVVFLTDKTPVKKLLVVLFALLVAGIPLYIRLGRALIRKPLKPLADAPKARFLLFIFSAAGLCILAGLVIPSALAASSPQEFSFVDAYAHPAQLILFPFLQAAGFFIFWCGAIYLLFSDNVKTMLTFVLSVFSVAALINTFVFVGDYGSISETLRFATGIPRMPDLLSVLKDLGTVVSSVALVLLCVRFLPPRFLESAYGIAAAGLLLFSCVNFFSIGKSWNEYAAVLSGDSGEKPDVHGITPVYHLSPLEENVVVIMLDRAINAFIPYIFEEMPETAKQFAGFTYYPNTVSFSGHTLIGVPPLFGGYEYTPEKINERTHESLREKHNEALTVLPLLFSESGFSSTITDAPWANYSWVPDNRIFSAYPGITARNLARKYTSRWMEEHGITVIPRSSTLKRNLLFFSFFRMMPSSLRGGLYDDGNWWNTELDGGSLEKTIDAYAVLDYLPELTAADSSVPAFVFMINDTTHDSLLLQYPDYVPSPEITDTGTNRFGNDRILEAYHVNAAAIRLLGQWFEWMRSQGVYDNTRIIIVSDHGYSDVDIAFRDMTSDDIEWGFYNPLLMVKDFNAGGPVRTDMTFMTTADVPFLAAENVIEHPVNPFTGAEITEDGKQDGVTIETGHRITPEQHNKNTLILENLYHVKNNIFEKKNWSKIQ